MAQLRCDIPMCVVVFFEQQAWSLSQKCINLQYMIHQLCQLCQLSCFSCFSWIQYSPIYSHNIFPEFKFRYEDIMSSAWRWIFKTMNTWTNCSNLFKSTYTCPQKSAQNCSSLLKSTYICQKKCSKLFKSTYTCPQKSSQNCSKYLPTKSAQNCSKLLKKYLYLPKKLLKIA